MDARGQHGTKKGERNRKLELKWNNGGDVVGCSTEPLEIEDRKWQETLQKGDTGKSIGKEQGFGSLIGVFLH